MKVKDNTGTTAAAGVVTGARLGRPGDSNAVVGESGLSRSDRRGQRAGCKAVVCAFACLRMVPGTHATTKGLTGLTVEIRLEGVPAAEGFRRRPREREIWIKDALAGGILGPFSDDTTGCAVRAGRPGRGFLGWNGYRLAAANCGIQRGRRQFAGRVRPRLVLLSVRAL
jgi:hypothetical protein